MPKLLNTMRAVLFFVLFTTPVGVAKSPDAQERTKQRIVVNASPRNCWDAIRNPLSCPEPRKVLSFGEREAVVEETFNNLPLLHTSTCVLQESEVPLKRIDFRLIRSDKFKKMEGAWIITPVADGKTLIELEAYVDPGVHVPFAKKVANDVNQEKCKERLNRVKSIAEATAEHEKLASKRM